MNPLNNVNFVGRCVADPEQRTTPNGIAVATVRIAVDRPYRKDKERIADFFTIECWRALAPYLCRNWRKGKPIAVIGEMHSESYTDKDGIKRYAVKLIADTVSFVPNERSSDYGSEPAAPEYDDIPMPGDDDAPEDYVPHGENEVNL